MVCAHACPAVMHELSVLALLLSTPQTENEHCMGLRNGLRMFMALQPRMKIGTGGAPEHKFQRICYFRRGHHHISQCIPALGHNMIVLATCKPSHATTIAGSTKTQEESPSPQDSDYTFARCWCQGICWHSRRRGSRSFCLVARRSCRL